MKKIRKIQIGVIGSYDDLPIAEFRTMAKQLGEEIADVDAIFIGGVEKNGGLVREAAKAARNVGGIVVSIPRKKENASDCDIVIPTQGAIGLREYILPLACDVIISINGGSGTLNEITVAYQNNIPVIILADTGGWSEKLQNTFLDERKKYKFIAVKTPQEAVSLAIQLANKRS